MAPPDPDPDRTADANHPAEPADKDTYYLDILDGLARYVDSPLLKDLVATLLRTRDPALGHAFNKNQFASKTWLLEELLRAAGPGLGTVFVLGGWVGVLSAVLLADRRLQISRVVSIDRDPACAPLAESLNRTHAAQGRFTALTADMHDIDYAGHPLPPAEGSGPSRRVSPTTVINTSCEHLPDFAGWYARIPEGTLLALQSNDMAGVEGHVNCVTDLESFRAQAPMNEPLFAGALPRKRYTRFMLIGRR